MEITHTGQDEKKEFLNGRKPKASGTSSKQNNIHIVGFQKKRERVRKIFEEIMAETFPNLRKQTNIQLQEAHKVTNKMNPKRTTPRHIIIKIVKVKNKENFKSSKRKTTYYIQGKPHKTIIQ